MVTKEDLMEQMVGFINNEVSKELEANKSALVKFSDMTQEQREEWIKSLSVEDVVKVIELIKDFFTDTFDSTIDDEVCARLKDNDEYVRKDDIDADMVDDLGLSEEVSDNYIGNLSHYDTIEKIKDMLDSI